MPDHSQQSNYSSAMADYTKQMASNQQNSKYRGQVGDFADEMRDEMNDENVLGSASDYNFLYTGNVYRNAWSITTKKRQNKYAKTRDSKYAPLYFNVNPASYQFDNPFRQNVVQAKGGPVVHTFRDPKRDQSNLGFPTINIEMSSGSLMPRATAFGEEAKTDQYWISSPNVSNFYKWLEIIQEDTVYQDGDNILPNYQIIEMSTVLFPHITLKGYFTQNANWSENAENPNEIQNWQVQFLIYDTIPTLKGQDLSALYNGYEKWFNELQLAPST